ncbi:cytochrome P450 18a1 [Parasteatoda tepidariorum]|uniref:cytochrome P450 18a1 n=1 Tax=Parasteatoda tepidariorum TaxID=114398 RepID=UPI001C729208|nr:cytochrome P450 18a1 [Parasteatoda tepidariorum]
MDKTKLLINAWEVNSLTNTLLVLLVSSLSLFILQKIVKKLWSGKKLPPGPLGLPVLGYIPFLGPEPHKKINSLRKKYGDIIGLYLGTKYTVVLNEYSIMKEVYSNPSSLDRATEQFGHMADFGFGTLNGKPWQDQRKFTMSTMKDLGIGKEYFEEVVRDEVAEFIKYLKTLDGKPTHIFHPLQFSIASNIIAFLIGRKLDKVKEADIIQLSMDFNRIISLVSGTTMAVVNVPGLSKLYQFLGIAGFKEAARVSKDFNAFFRREVENRLKSSNSQVSHDFLGVYLEELSKLGSDAREKYFSEKMLVGNAVLLFVGGSDTIFASLIWLLRLMADRKDVQDKVYTEIKSVLGMDGKAKYEERDLIPYTFAVLMEAQRYSGFVRIPASRIAIEEINIKGYTIPKGSYICSNLWAIHHDPNYWKEPMKFKPERFLSDDGKKLSKSPPSFAPFSIGRRNCPGGVTAWMEILSYFTEIMKYYEVTTAPGEKVDFTATTGLIAALLPQRLSFKLR